MDILITLWRPNRPKPARLSILLCLMPDDFTRQWGTPGSQWVKTTNKIHHFIHSTGFRPKVRLVSLVSNTENWEYYFGNMNKQQALLRCWKNWTGEHWNTLLNKIAYNLVAVNPGENPWLPTHRSRHMHECLFISVSTNSYFSQVVLLS